MLKALVTSGDGKRVLMVGLSFGNLERFRAEPGDTFIRIRGEQMGLDNLDVVLFSGRTEEEMARLVEQMANRDG